jgi:hypothetical protein
MVVWYSLLSFGIFFPFRYVCTKETSGNPGRKAVFCRDFFKSEFQVLPDGLMATGIFGLADAFPPD